MSPQDNRNPEDLTPSSKISHCSATVPISQSSTSFDQQHFYFIMDGKLLSPSSAASPGAMQICNLCQKPFLNQSSYNRHVLYCRRARNRPRARIRSCQACTKSKRKCSGQLQCNRCTNKGLSCVYDVNKPIISASPRNSDESHSAENVAPSAIAPPIEATEEETCGGIGMADTFLTVRKERFLNGKSQSGPNLIPPCSRIM